MRYEYGNIDFLYELRSGSDCLPEYSSVRKEKKNKKEKYNPNMIDRSGW